MDRIAQIYQMKEKICGGRGRKKTSVQTNKPKQKPKEKTTNDVRRYSNTLTDCAEHVHKNIYVNKYALGCLANKNKE